MDSIRINYDRLARPCCTTAKSFY